MCLGVGNTKLQKLKLSEFKGVVKPANSMQTE
jgi:hypothetical protein